MQRFLLAASYTPQGAKAILAGGGTARRSAVEKMCADVGGHLVTFDFAFGADDVYTVVELPDSRTAAAIALTINASEAVHVRTVPLMTPEEVDALGQVQANYQPPTA